MLQGREDEIGRLESLIELGVLTEQAESPESVATMAASLRELGQSVLALVQARSAANTSYDYSEIEKSLSKVVSFAERSAVDSEPRWRSWGTWLGKVGRAFLQYQVAEVHWCLSNLDKARTAYNEAASLFRAACYGSEDPSPTSTGHRATTYVAAFAKLCEGTSIGIEGYSRIADGRREEGCRLLDDARKFRGESSGLFVSIGNNFWAREAVSFTDSKDWLIDTTVRVGSARVTWLDYSILPSPETLAAHRFQVSSWENLNWGQLVLGRTPPELFRGRTAQIGTVTLPEVGGTVLPKLSVKLRVHGDRVLVLEYRLELKGSVSVFLLDVLRNFNTTLVPDYEAQFEPEKAITLARASGRRLGGLSKTLLKTLLAIPDDKVPEISSSSVEILLEQFDPSVKVSGLGKTGFLSFNALFRGDPNAVWRSPSELEKFPENILAGIVDPSRGVLYQSDSTTILLSASLQVWETRLFLDIMSLVTTLRESISGVAALILTETGTVRSQLEEFRNDVLAGKEVTRKQLDRLVTKNLAMRLSVLELLEARALLARIKFDSTAVSSPLIVRASDVTGLNNRLSEIDLELAGVETLYNTAYNFSQEFLSMNVTINSEISRQVFAVLNIVLVGSLGLALLTAVERTPVDVTFAFLAVGVSALGGGLFAALVTRREQRRHGRLGRRSSIVARPNRRRH